MRKWLGLEAEFTRDWSQIGLGIWLYRPYRGGFWEVGIQFGPYEVLLTRSTPDDG